MKTCRNDYPPRPYNPPIYTWPRYIYIILFCRRVHKSQLYNYVGVGPEEGVNEQTVLKPNVVYMQVYAVLFRLEILGRKRSSDPIDIFHKRTTVSPSLILESDLVRYPRATVITERGRDARCSCNGPETVTDGDVTVEKMQKKTE